MISASRTQKSSAISAEAASGPARILLVDDLEANLAAMEALLQYEGVEIHRALSGEAALELLLVHDFALAIVDVQMPVMNGFELAVLMRGTERTRHVPIIFVTAGSHDRQSRFQGYEAGAVDFLYKPIEPDILRQKTAIFLELYETRREIARQRDELRKSQQNLAAELYTARRLQELSTRLTETDQPSALYEHILETTLAVTSADCAALHLVEEPGVLNLIGWVGVPPEALPLHQRVPLSATTACAEAVRRRQRVIVADLGAVSRLHSDPATETCLRAGIRAIQSTCVYSRDGRALGAISTGWRQARTPREHELWSLDVVARQAADLIERTRATDAMRASNQRLRFMAESMPPKIFTARPDGMLDYSNERWTEFTGMPVGALLGSGWIALTHPEDREKHRTDWEHAVATGRDFETEHRIRGRDGTYRWHLSSAHAMRDEAGRVTMWIGSSTDIHAQKETEAELRRLNDDLKYFAYAASHDLQEPLRMVSIYSEMLLRESGAASRKSGEMCVRHIKSGTERMRVLLADLLSYTQLTRASQAGDESCDLNHALDLALEQLQPGLEDSGARLTRAALPVIRGNQSQFVQLFQNLVGNALRYRSADAPVIEIACERRNHEWCVSVADNGIGIAPEYHHKIFGVFKRLHGPAIPGTGIGLAICQRVVEGHGGRIWVESESGKGAKFCFTVPADETEAPPGR